MKTNTQLVILFVAMIMMTECIHGATIEPPQDWCRMSDEVTRCVGTPVPIPAEDYYCPVEVCKMSYIRAEPCPLDGAQATARCEVQEISTTVWDCKPDAVPRRTTVPLGCDPTNNGCQEVMVCTCELRALERTKFVFKREKTPKCNADISSRGK